MSLENVERVREQCQRLDTAEINNAIILLSKTAGEMTYSTQPRVLLELAVVQLATGMSQMVQMQPGTQMQSKQPAKQAQQMKPSPEIKKTAPSQGSIEVKPTDEPEREEVKSEPKNVADMDMEEVWRDVCNEAVSKNPMLIVVQQHTFPKKMTSGEMVIGALNTTAVMMLEKEKEKLTEILRKQTGSNMHIVIAGDDEKKDKGQNVEETAHMVEDILGVHVKIED